MPNLTEKLWELHEIGRELAKMSEGAVGVFDQRRDLAKLRLILDDAQEILLELE